MRKYVLDCNVLLKAFLPDRDGSDMAQKILALLVVGDILVLSHRNLVYEFCGSIVRIFRRRHKPVQEAISAIRSFRKLPIEYVDDTEEMLERATEFSMGHAKSWYDMYYFALAEQAGVAVCTADEKCVAGLPGDFPCEYVLLQDFRA